jgi:hypothetical protein
MNDLFVKGQQWLFYNPSTRIIEEAPRDVERVRLTLNRMKSTSRTVIGKLTQRDLSFEVQTTDADDSHVRGARLGESLLENIRIAHNWEQKREAAAWAAWKGGSSIIAVEWDPNAGDVVAAPDGTAGSQPLKKGDSVETVLNLTEFTVEPGTRDAERARWWIKCQLMPPEEVQARFRLDWVPEADGRVDASPYQARLLEGESADVNLTRVYTYYERPNFLCERGKVLTIVNDQVVFKNEEWPFPWKDHLNFAMIRETIVESKWAGETVLSDARGIQVALNQSWSNIVEHMKRAGNARLAVQMSNIDLMDDLTDLPGDIFGYADGTNPPDYVSPPQMPQWWIEQPAMLSQEMDDVLGVHQISRGDAPVNIESGYGLSILAEHDATPIERMTKEQAIAWGKVASMDLKLFAKMVPDEDKRELQVQTPGQAPRKVAWSGKDFRGQTTALVPQDAIMPRSRAAAMQLAREAVQMGMVQDFATFAFIAELPGARQMLAGVSPDIDRARRENAGFALGRQAEPYPEDDHQAHIMEHNRYIKSVDFELLDPEEKQLVRTHCQAHLTMEAEALGQQQAKGAVGGQLLAGMSTVQGPPPADPALAVPPPAQPEPEVQEVEVPPDAEAVSAQIIESLNQPQE